MTEFAEIVALAFEYIEDSPFRLFAAVSLAILAMIFVFFRSESAIYKLISVVIAITAAGAAAYLYSSEPKPSNNGHNANGEERSYNPIAAGFRFVAFKEYGAPRAHEGYRAAQKSFSNVYLASEMDDPNAHLPTGVLIFSDILSNAQILGRRLPVLELKPEEQVEGVLVDATGARISNFASMQDFCASYRLFEPADLCQNIDG